MQKRKKRRVKGDSRLSFFDEIDNGSDEEDMENSKFMLSCIFQYVCYSRFEVSHCLRTPSCLSECNLFCIFLEKKNVFLCWMFSCSSFFISH